MESSRHGVIGSIGPMATCTAFVLDSFPRAVFGLAVCCSSHRRCHEPLGRLLVTVRQCQQSGIAAWQSYE